MSAQMPSLKCGLGLSAATARLTGGNMQNKNALSSAKDRSGRSTHFPLCYVMWRNPLLMAESRSLNPPATRAAGATRSAAARDLCGPPMAIDHHHWISAIGISHGLGG